MAELQAYRGVGTEYPADTLTAFQAAAEQGYASAAAEVQMTADGRFLASADAAFGAMDWEAAARVDCGSRFNLKFAGEQAALLEEVLELAERTGLRIRICGADRQKEPFFALLADRSCVELTCSDAAALQALRQRFPKMPLHYDGAVTEEILRTIAGPRLTVWLDWRQRELAPLVKRYARLGVGLLSEYADLEEAEALGADVILTRGQLKPVRRQGVLADLHLHSRNSHDASWPVEDMIRAEMAAGVKIAAIADHCDTFLCGEDPETDIYTNIQESFAETTEVRELVKGQCLVLRGIELGETFWAREQAERVLRQCPYDVVVGSVHAVKIPAAQKAHGMNRAYAQIDFTQFTDGEMDEFLTMYFDDLLTLATTTEMDILAHLTCPITYPFRQTGKLPDVRPYEAKIEEILQAVIDRGIALECNSSRLVSGYCHPLRWIIERYRQMGGYLVTLASDAHDPAAAGRGLEEMKAMLKEIGFRNIFYYEKRRSYQCTL